MNVRLSNEARQDVRGIAEYFDLETGSFSISNRFLAAFQTTCMTLQQFPEIGVAVRGLHPDFAGWRRIPLDRYPQYLVFYRHNKSTIVVERIMHGSRDLIAILGDGSSG
ncbi:MAG: type II toxin-antitoxin system RelE/ParE family toxin [Acidobacteriota bacterium]|nr:type II toxin-antitoxin system RelE/ParE family toxin [Acidobacteriota bacterium]